MIEKTLEVFTSVGWVCTFGHTQWTRYFQKNHMWHLRGLGCTIFFNKLKSFGHRHRLDFFTRWAWVTCIKIGDVWGTSTQACALKNMTIIHMVFKQKNERIHTILWNTRIQFTNPMIQIVSLRLSNITSKSYVFNNWILITKFVTK